MCRDDLLYLFLDRSRLAGFLDWNAEASLVGLGTAAENLVFAAHARGLEVEQRLFSWPNPHDVLARFQFTRRKRPTSEPHEADPLVRWLEARHTNHGLGRPDPIPAEWREEMRRAAESVPGARVQFLEDRPSIEAVARLAGAADRLRFFNERSYRDILTLVRWTDGEARAAGDGIPIRNLGLDEVEEAALRLCRHREPIELLRSWKAGRGLEKHLTDAVRQSSALGLITMPSPGLADLFRGGRAAERLWLAATSRGLALQPIMVLLYFFARLERGRGEGLDGEEKAALSELRRKYGKYFSKGAGTEVFLFRLAVAEPPAVRPPRLPLDEILIRLPARSRREPRKRAA